MNRLGSETSPYLRQHAANPVDWWSWGAEAFATAKERDVPVLLSIGYSACHWCHVMAHESFEDPTVAALMNRLFVCVKVDREERPDVDAVYMDAVQTISGRGGWPMTMFLAPDGRPFFGGTYYPPSTFTQLIETIGAAWLTNRDDLLDQAGQLTDSLARTGNVQPADDLPSAELMNAAVQDLANRFDAEWGGFGGAPKFPSSMSIDLLLRSHVASGSPETLAMVATTLDAMASGGMYDHLGGGFARYSVDERWLVPHFEKMLYDQALLARVYLHAYLVTGNQQWRLVVEETIDYVLRDLRHPNGGFYSAQDADSLDADGHSVEGSFYTWTPDEIGDDDLCHWYAITSEGNFEGRSIPNRIHARGELTRPEHIEAARAAALARRGQRPPPGLDDKVLAEWNALFLTTLAEASAALDRDDWRRAAIANGDFLCSTLRGADGRWRRSWQAAAGEARHHALAADHAALVEAFVALAEATGLKRWLDEALTAADQLLDRFWDAEAGGVYTTAHDGEQLIARQKDLMDNATPAANSMAAVGLLRLGALSGERRYIEHAHRILRLYGRIVRGAPAAFSHLLAAADMVHSGLAEIVIAGNRPDLVRAVHEKWLPNTVTAWGERADGPMWEGRRDGFAYVCRDYTCKAPVDSVETLRAAMDDGGDVSAGSTG